jgi:hypothetical protein
LRRVKQGPAGLDDLNIRLACPATVLHFPGSLAHRLPWSNEPSHPMDSACTIKFYTKRPGIHRRSDLKYQTHPLKESSRFTRRTTSNLNP